MTTQHYVYKRSEPNLWTVCYYDPLGKWQPESDHESRQEAVKQVHTLNGNPTDLLQHCKMILDAYHQWNLRAENGEDDLHYAARQLQYSMDLFKKK